MTKSWYIKKRKKEKIISGGENMKNTIKFMIFFIAIFASLFMIPNISHAETPVTDEESLLSAIESDDYVTLQNNITVTKPIVVAKEITIDGNGYTVTGSSDWTSTSGNQTMFTAQFSNAKLTLKDINLQNGPKYGVQSYDGATVILNNVSITGFRYGGVLVNGGKVEVIDLHLGYNGTGNNNGIEIDKGASATNNPTLVMNGVLTTDTNENVVRVAENGHLTEFTVTNTSTTTNKVILAGETIALVNSNNEIISETTVPEKATANADTQNAIITLVAKEETTKMIVDLGQTITEEFLKSHIDLEENEQIDGFFTDAQYESAFNFSDPINADTSIYAKISVVENEPEPEEDNNTVIEEPETEEKDETPKTGVQSYLGLSVILAVLSIGAMIFLKKKM